MKRFAYTDESGNSGLKLFDTDQETFWTGTLISYADLDRKYGTFHRELLAAAGRSELHGADLGFGGIEKIASRLAWFIREKKLHFLFGRVNKPYLAASKLFDLVFDPGSNPAVPPHAYEVQQLRQLNLMHFIQLLSEEDLREFWDLFAKQDSGRLQALLLKIITKIEDSPFDPRTRQILTDTLTWGSENPREVLDPFSECDSPNFVAFCGLLGHLHELHEKVATLLKASSMTNKTNLHLVLS